MIVKILISMMVKMLANMISLDLKKGILCALVQNVKMKKIWINSGKLVVIAKIAKNSIGEIEYQKIKKLIRKQEKKLGLKNMGEIVNFASENLLEEEKNIAVQNVFLKIIFKKEKMDVGNGMDYKIQQDMDISQIMRLIKGTCHIDILMNYIKERLQKTCMFVINAIIRNVVLPNICFWEQIKTICRTVKLKEELLRAIRLQEKAKKMVMPFLQTKLYCRSEVFVLKDLKIKKLQQILKLLFFKLMQLDTGELGSISKEVILGRL
jgi:predicted RNA-binding protein YlxR (DUF448 family)